MTAKKPQRIKLGARQAMALLAPYVKDRLMTQIKSVWLIILYLVFFQVFILKIKIFEASVVAVGIGLVVVGLTFFMEGLFLGLMRLGSLVGGGLPKKASIWIVVAFALVLGFLATLAEPSIQVLQMAGTSVKPWEAPLLFLLLNKYPHYLVYSVGSGVGLAVGLGMLRFYYSISLKPFIYVFVGALVLITAWANFDENMKSIIGLAWDCGAVTTGPVTVPLVLALGIGVSRMVGSVESGTTGFGVVTLASLLPAICVLGLGLFFNGSAPEPMDRAEFFTAENRSKIERLFKDGDALTQYVQSEADPETQAAFFGNNAPKTAPSLPVPNPSKTGSPATASQAGIGMQQLVGKNFAAAFKAIGLLTIPLFLVFFLLVREALPYPDEILLGIFFCILGLATFSIGIELGLDKLGTQVGNKLPAAFKAIPIPEEDRTIADFDPDLVKTAISEDGRKHHFFFVEKNGKVQSIPYDSAAFDPETGKYYYTPTKGPLFGSGSPLAGVFVVVLFAFIMGYGATLAEPALNALGITVEEVTAGTFKKSFLMQAVAIGVGAGIALGVTKIVLAIPLAWILLPPYVLLLVVTKLSTEEFVNIGWDSAGVTTGPITVPLVLAMGLGIGSQVGVVEGFGILASASVFPILSVLLFGLHINRKRKAALEEDASAET
ncbi:MAG: DUF1538 domain-containing protein [Desulfobacterales bacterium]|nr:DUF1538 domain-containing protein [Desulfobacterales bacterium]MCF8078400.1 DUF1538 domain-containing protein [Desulfobacterales bacterium]